VAPTAVTGMVTYALLKRRVSLNAASDGGFVHDVAARRLKGPRGDVHPARAGAGAVGGVDRAAHVAVVPYAVCWIFASDPVVASGWPPR